MIDNSKLYFVHFERVVQTKSKIFGLFPHTEYTVEKRTKEVTEEQYNLLKDLNIRHYAGWTITGKVKRPGVEKMIDELLED